MTSLGFSGAGIRSTITCLGGGVGGGSTFSMTVGCVAILGGVGGLSRMISGGGVGGGLEICLEDRERERGL